MNINEIFASLRTDSPSWSSGKLPLSGGLTSRNVFWKFITDMIPIGSIITKPQKTTLLVCLRTDVLKVIVVILNGI